MSEIEPDPLAAEALQAREARAANVVAKAEAAKQEVLAVVHGLGAQGVFHGYQKRAVIASHLHELVVVEKSRRVGITWAFAGDDAVTAATGAGGDDVLYISYSQDMAREYIDACAGFAKAFMGIDAVVGEYLFDDEDPVSGETKGIKAFRIDFASGHTIQALSSAPRSLRGKQGRVRIDEGAFVNNLRELLKAALALVMLGGSVVVMSSHNGADNDFNLLIQAIHAGEREGKVITITFDDALNDGLYERIAHVRGLDTSPEAKAAWVAKIRKLYGDAAAEELDCIPSKGTGSWLAYDLVERAEAKGTPVLRWIGSDELKFRSDEAREEMAATWCAENLSPQLEKMGLNVPVSLGIDFARRTDLSIIWPLQEMQDRTLVTPFVIEIRNVPYREQEFVAKYLLRSLRRWGAAVDAGGNGGYLAERLTQAFGEARVTEVNLRSEFWRIEAPSVKARFEDERISIPQDRDLSSDLRAIKVKGGIPYVPEARERSKGDDAPKGTTRHADGGVALVLAHYRHRQGVAGPIDFKSAAPTGIRGEGAIDNDRGFGVVESDVQLRGF